MSVQTFLSRLVQKNVAYELAIEQLHTSTGYYLCKHTLVDQFPDLPPAHQVELLQRISEQLDRSAWLEGPITRQDWIQIHQQLSNS